MKNVFFILVFIFIFSCKYGVDFEVKNKSNTIIDSLNISNGYDEIRFGIIGIGEVRSEVLKFTNNTPNNDGSYKIEYYYGKLFRKESFGYYSNGIPLNSSFSIVIEKDSIRINEINTKY